MTATNLPSGGTLVQLRLFEAGDAHRIAALASDERISAPTTNIPHPYTLQHAHEYLASTVANREAGTGYHWAVVAQNTGLLSGVVGLEVSLRDSTAHLGYWIGVDYWGQGLASEAVSLVAGWAHALGIQKLAARCLVTNQGSIKVLQRCGLTQEGLLRSHVLRGKQRHDVLCYGRVLPS